MKENPQQSPAQAIPESEPVRHELPSTFPVGDATQAGRCTSPQTAVEVTAEASATVSRQDWPRIPGYAVEGILGEGGMGVIYRARQQTLHRLVALKMILAGPHASREAVDRFLNEIASVAVLQHQNIVQIYDTGQFDGQPFFVMELIEGIPLNQRMTDKPFTYRDAAELIFRLATAMEYAHQRGIIHRDLKPSNILLCADGTPKIMDFGIAKRKDIAQDLTAAGSVLGTPGYLSPEQAQGQSTSATTDVFSLGVILYEMVTGRKPFDGVSDVEILNKIIHEEPPSPAWYRPSVPKDLETICLKSLHKNPARRYASAQELADDLQAFLDGKIIRARRAGRLERLWRWARRHPGWSTLAAVALITIPSIIGGLAWSNERLSTSYARSQRLVKHNSDLSMWVIQDHLDDLQEINGSADIQMQLVSKVQQFLDNTQQESTADPVLKRRVAMAYERVGDILGNPNYQNLGRPNDALTSYRNAARLLQEADALVSNDPVTSVLHVRCLLKISEIVTQTDGIAAAGEWIDLAEAEIQAKADDGDLWKEVKLRFEKSRYWQMLANNDPAGTLAILDRIESLIEPESESLDIHSSEFNTRQWLAENRGRTEEQLGNYAQAKLHYQQMLILTRQALASNPSSNYLQDQVSSALISLGDSLTWLNELEGAGQTYDESLAFRRQLVEADPSNVRFLSNLSIALERTGKLLFLQQEFDKALMISKECIDLRRRLRTLDDNFDSRRSLWVALHLLADAQCQLNRLDEAEAVYRETLDMIQQVNADAQREFPEMEAIGEAYTGLGSIEFKRWIGVMSTLDKPQESAHYRLADQYYQRAIATFDEIGKRSEEGVRQARSRQGAEKLLATLRSTADQLSHSAAGDDAKSNAAVPE